jgi:nucleotide-binding universal stress UspA family protein
MWRPCIAADAGGIVMAKTRGRILVPVDFSPCSDAALRHALAIADASGAEVEVLYVWSPRDANHVPSTSAIFADTPQGRAMQERLSAAESFHATRVCGRLEFGDDPSQVILGILERESFDMVVMGMLGDGTSRREQPPPESGHVAASVAKTATCKVVTLPPPSGDTEAA